MPLRTLTAAACLALLAGCAVRRPPAGDAPPLPPVVPHAGWHTQPPVGHAADAMRRNLAAGGTLTFRDLAIEVLGTGVDSTDAPADVVRLRLTLGDAREERTVREGRAIRWQGHRVAVVAVHGPGELGAGLAALEVATLASLPDVVARSDSAGGAAMRLRVPHRITHVTLHHTGSARPLRPEDDPRERLRGLQAWGARDRNWWDVPYHFLIDLDGRIYEGRDWRYMGETNTAYDPRGHLLISVIGNYGLQEATAAQLDAIAGIMAWAVARFDVPVARIGGHYDHAETSCPGTHLRKHLEDGSLHRMVRARLAAR